ncbi:hypothetical protein L1049_019583 [Liquidambar formosana]|uniref:TRF2/HOY1 PH-like domain-containing protein n=1 Tax=Liquidambar formosana TaxID=63359 RepID=A0AAP0SCS9_LIQFO
MVQGGGIFMWADKDGGRSGFSAAGEFRNSPPSSVDSNRYGVSGFERSEAGNKRVKLTNSNQQEEAATTLEEASPLGLTLNKTPSFLNLIEMMLSSQERKTDCSAEEPQTNHSSDHGGVQAKVDDYGSQPMSEKLKASNFSASFLKIGAWERATKYEGDLVAKCYYAKRKLVWEVLERGLKKKIELQWSDILAIRATIEENQPGILEIELNQPPSFFQETNPQPRKHTLWQLTSDFTGGQAPIFRRHYMKFPPGALDKHYEKLLQCDSRLFELSQKPFPSLRSPYFYSNFYGFSEFSHHFNGSVAEISHGLHYPLSSIPATSLVSSHHQVQSLEQTPKSSLGIKDSPSPMSVMDFSPIDENISNHGFENPRTTFWGQGINNDMMGRQDHIEEVPFTASATQVNPSFPNQEYRLLHYGEGLAARPKRNTPTLGDIERLLLSDSQVAFSDERQLLARVRSMCSLIEQTEEVSPANVIAAKHMNFRQDRAPGDHLVLSTADQYSSGNGGLIYQQLPVREEYSPAKVVGAKPMGFRQDRAPSDYSVLSISDQYSNGRSGLIYQQRPIREEVSPAIVAGAKHMDFRQDRAVGDHVILNTTDHSNGKGGLIFPQPIHWVPSPEVFNENLLMRLPRNSSLHSYDFSAPTREDFSAVDTLNETNRWTQ